MFELVVPNTVKKVVFPAPGNYKAIEPNMLLKILLHRPGTSGPGGWRRGLQERRPCPASFSANNPQNPFNSQLRSTKHPLTEPWPWRLLPKKLKSRKAEEPQQPAACQVCLCGFAMGWTSSLETVECGTRRPQKNKIGSTFPQTIA